MAGTDQRSTCVCRVELATSRWTNVPIKVVTALPVVVDINFMGNRHEQLEYVGRKRERVNESTLVGKELGGPLNP